jgi:hypothetical protein
MASAALSAWPGDSIHVPSFPGRDPGVIDSDPWTGVALQRAARIAPWCCGQSPASPGRRRSSGCRGMTPQQPGRPAASHEVPCSLQRLRSQACCPGRPATGRSRCSVTDVLMCAARGSAVAQCPPLLRFFAFERSASGRPVQPAIHSRRPPRGHASPRHHGAMFRFRRVGVLRLAGFGPSWRPVAGNAPGIWPFAVLILPAGQRMFPSADTPHAVGNDCPRRWFFIVGRPPGRS